MTTAGYVLDEQGIASEPRRIKVAVIGAGQAGLSAAYHLRRSGFEPHREYVVFDSAPGPGGAWQHRWPTLRFDQVHGVHDLPGLAMTPPPPQARASQAMSEYFAEYEQRFALPILRQVRVHAVRDLDGVRLRIDTSDGSWDTYAVINASGSWERPFWPYYPGRDSFAGRQLHTADYAGPDEFAGQHVVVVGGGTSAIHLLLEIAEVASTTWVTRTPPMFRAAEFTPEYGRFVVDRVRQRVEAGQPLDSVVHHTGLPTTPAIRAGLKSGVLSRYPMFDRIEQDRVVWADGRTQRADTIVWATGFRPALDHLAPLRLREAGGGIAVKGTRVVSDPRLHLVGYGPSASTVGATRAGRFAVREVRQLLGRQLPGSTGTREHRNQKHRNRQVANTAAHSALSPAAGGMVVARRAGRIEASNPTSAATTSTAAS